MCTKIKDTKNIEPRREKTCPLGTDRARSDLNKTVWSHGIHMEKFDLVSPRDSLWESRPKRYMYT